MFIFTQLILLMGRAGWLRGLLLVACLAGGDAYVVPTSQHVLQLAARRAASPPPRAPSTTATVPGDYQDAFDKRMKVRRVPLGWSLHPTTTCVRRVYRLKRKEKRAKKSLKLTTERSS